MKNVILYYLLPKIVNVILAIIALGIVIALALILIFILQHWRY